MKWLVILSVVLFASACRHASGIEIGKIDQNEPPTNKDLVPPSKSDDIDKVALRAAVTGKVADGEKRKVYVLVNPLSNPATKDVWWVQEETKMDDARFTCSCQFGEGTEGSDEYFAIVALATSENLSVGEMLHGIPKKYTYSKLKIVKRK